MTGPEGPKTPNRSPFAFFGEMWKRIKEAGLVDQNVRVIHSIIEGRAQRLHKAVGPQEGGAFPAIGTAHIKLYDAFVAARQSGTISDTEAPKYAVLKTIHDELKATETIWNEGVLHYRTDGVGVLETKLGELKSKVIGYADLVGIAHEVMKPMHAAMDEILVTLVSSQETLQGLIKSIPDSPIGRELDEFLLTIEGAIERLQALKR